jgi:hypothetical protein
MKRKIEWAMYDRVISQPWRRPIFAFLCYFLQCIVVVLKIESVTVLVSQIRGYEGDEATCVVEEFICAMR